jgi:OmcA/MtrC family decaheme c-type cytochrome
MRRMDWMAAGLALAVGAAGCGKDETEPAAAPPQVPAPVPADNLAMEIVSVTLPDGDAVRPQVRFKITDASGNPIDLKSEIAAANAKPAGIPNTVPRFTLAVRDDRGDFTSYYASTVQPKAYTPPAGSTPPPAAPATQATFQPPSSAPWPVNDLAQQDDGSWVLTLGTTQVSGLDRTKPHQVAGWAVRTTAQGQDIAPASFAFTPSGGTPATRFQTITDEGCNRCHGTVQAHGTRRGVQLCITCHSPQSTDPETSRSVDFKVMIHKIHSGGDLPSVQQGQPYFIVGFSQNVSDFSDIGFPWNGGVRAACSVCHNGPDASVWKDRPTVAACTACHDNVKFTVAEASTSCANLPANAKFQDCLHDGGPIGASDRNDSTACAGCHKSGAIVSTDKFHDMAP